MNNTSSKKQAGTTKNMILYVVAGGSGGHILPALELARRWKEQYPEGSIIFFGSSSYLDQKITEQASCIDKQVSLVLSKFAAYKFWHFPRFIFQFMRIFCLTFAHISKQRPEKILSTGGLLALPVMLAGKVRGIPLELYELNVVPGKAIKFLALFAQKVFVTFKKSITFFRSSWMHKKCHYYPYPLRFVEADRLVDKTVLLDGINALLSTKHGRQRLFDTSRKTLFVLGGSQGSLMLNNLIKNFILTHPEIKSSLQVIHQTGYQDTTDWKGFYANHDIPAFTFSYHHAIKDFYLLADLVLCRAGAGTLFELLFFKKRSIVIPLIAQTTDHQVDNAAAMAEEHSALFTVLDQKVVQQNPSILYQQLLRVFQVS